jgi:hypothetical protein
VLALTIAPYNLPWGSSVFADVLATNIIGSSGTSAGGNGAIILITPDSPRNLANVPAITSATQIGLTWDTGSANGGTPVIDYQLSFDQGNGTFVVYQSGILATSITVTGLTKGRTYAFRV